MSEIIPNFVVVKQPDPGQEVDEGSVGPAIELVSMTVVLQAVAQVTVI